MFRIAALLLIGSAIIGASLTHATAASAAFTSFTSRAAPNLSGTYLFDKKHSDDPSHALDEATQSMGRFKRKAVQKRMSEGLKPADTLRIAMAGDTVSLQTSGRLHLQTVPGAEPKSRTGENGGTVQLSSAWDGDTLVVTTASDRFQREARYALEPDGQSIRVAISMSGSKSSAPIQYALVYRRVAVPPATT
jgi:hypothetical protein